jgi:proton-translocating NAD(P)+ transhydrogenase subunit alpha
MRIGVPKESAAGERRVALVPEIVGKLVPAGFEVLVERGAGETAAFPEAAYEEAGARIVDDAWSETDAVVKVQKPSGEEIARLREGQVLIGFLQPLTDAEGIQRLAERGVVAFAMESIPRITRAQPMDALSSQATVAGYKATLLAAERLPRFFPMLMTAAGTVAPAKVLVLGAGVAGLQAVATSRRLGAVVTGFDVRPVVREQIESLGANWLDLGIVGEETEGGYAQQLSEEQQRQQQDELEKRLPEFDVVITTALIPGRPAPRLIPAGAVRAMRPGSVIVDPAELDAVPRESAVRAQRLGAAAPPRAGGRADPRLGRRDHRRRMRGGQAGGRGVTRAVPPPGLWMVRPILGAVRAQTRVPEHASVPAEGGGTASPTQGGGFWFSRAHPRAAGEGSP